MTNCKKNKLKGYMGWILSLFILFSIISVRGGDVKASENNQSKKRVVAYFTEWSVYGGHNNYKISDVPWDKVTHINYAFATIKNNKIALFDKWAATEMNFGDGWDSPYNGNLGQIKKYKKLYPNVKVLISIGGWSQSAGFNGVAKTPENRKIFSDSVVEFIRQWNLDGADIDWEYPTFKREGDTIDNPNDQGTPWADEGEKQTFTLLLKDLREALNNAGREDNKYYELTAAVGCGKDKIEKTEPEKYSEYLDFINIMTYDMNGAWENVTGHQSPLYKNPYDNHENQLVREYYNVDTAMKLFESYGIPKDKLVVGSPYYSRGWKGVKNDGPIKELPGLFATATGGAKGTWDGGRAAGCNPYHYIKGTLEKDSSFKKYRDPYSKVPYLYSESKGEMYTYEDEISLGEKVKYVKDNNYGGIIFWELAGDAPLKGSSLTDVIYKGFFGGGDIPSDDKLPEAPVLSLKNNDTYGNYDINIAIPAASRGDKVKLYENNELILEEKLSDSSSKDIIKNFKEKKKGTYTYTAEIINKYGSSKGNSIVVEVLDPNALIAPVISVDKEINIGNYKISIEVLENNKGNLIKLYENGVEVLSESIDGLNKKVFTKEFKGKKIGEYTYKAEIVGKDNKIESNTLKVIVKEDNPSSKEKPAKPVLTHDNWENKDSYNITMNMWWGVNGDKIRLYENGVLVSEANLVSNTPQAQTYSFKVTERKTGKYTYYVELINEAGATRSDDLVVNVTGK
ncbi:glycosyl hydrolase family 18 protein [Clostridium sp. ZC22-4]|uniref:chitinase n=1 Tax=Clostridium brassicae TaxID=2999072 RepID=A0ABT4DC51_9CLOT|nr:glycosyl hydrolase family 18 protein [Clostridium brassicae]MCY6959892.1 glycosyl hydrolase family 18 protein [Clostridium brassicae]